ncbi:MAG: ROK family protein [Chthoniobacterales bacterium]|nr:ROK family protein [Chthoniobacterales bacterium]
MKKILMVDIGGTNVKLMISPEERRKFSSGKKLTPEQLVANILETAEDWSYDAVALGFPAPVRAGKIIKDPKHLGGGWEGFDFEKSLGKPTRVINDAALQALGSYHGGRMLFLGLGTGLGSTLIWDRNVLPLELGDLPFDDSATVEDQVGKRGLERLGRKAWQKRVLRVVTQLKVAFIVDYILLGGGNAKQFSSLPEGFELGHNRNAYHGGTRLWESDARTKQPKWKIIG